MATKKHRKASAPRRDEEETETTDVAPMAELGDVTSVEPEPESWPVASEWIKALETYVDSRVGSEWFQADVDTCLSYTRKIRDAGMDPTAIETFLKQRAFSSWRQEMANEVHAMVNRL